MGLGSQNDLFPSTIITSRLTSSTENVNGNGPAKHLASFQPVKGEIIRLESEKLIVDLSTKGGIVSAVQLKEYESYMNFAKNDGKVTPLYLFKDGDQLNQLTFNIGANKYATGNKAFEVVSKSKHKVVLKHDVADGSIIYTYNLKGGYDLGYTIEMKDLNGKVLQSVQVVGQQTTIDLSNYTPGVYLITLQVGEQVNTQRIIKQ